MDRSWPALVVDRVQKEQLRWNQDGRIDIRELPVERVYVSSRRIATHILPIELVRVSASQDVKKMAVLSWRWDIERGEISRNIFAAVLYARHAGIRYLFIDTISIDQSLDKENLINEVAAFSQLYATVPAIRAYDKIGEAISSTARRPWIFHEQQLIKRSPYRAISIRHSTDFSIWRELTDVMTRPWDTTYFQSAVLVLHGTVGMADITDFRFLMPSFCDTIMRFHKEMTRNDYLLTVAILSAMGDPDDIWAPNSAEIEKLQYERYTFKGRRRGFGYNLLLDGEKIGEWKTSVTFRAREFEFVPLAEELILKQLGLSQDKRIYSAKREGITIPLNLSSMTLGLQNTWKKLLPEDSFFWGDLEHELVWKDSTI